MNQCKLLIEGWNIGFNKVEFTKLLQRELNLSLSSAKAVTDQILEGKQLKVDVPRKEMDRIVAAAEALGAKVRPDSVLVEDSCQ